MKNLTIATLIFACGSIPAAAQNAASDAEEQAREIADAVREFNEALGPIVEGELSASQIDTFERMIAPALNVDVQHETFCNMLAFGSAAVLLRARTGLSDPSTPPEMIDVFTELADGATADIVPGSMEDWLFQFSVPLIVPLGLERTTAAGLHECLQHPMAHAMFSSVPMNSEEMRVEQKCLKEDICS